jgi:DNA-binding transcriptional LysR family regulator
MRSLDTEALRAFIIVANSGSFSIAASQLGLTQPAVSKRIAQLESQLGTKILDRVSKKVALNEAGRTLLPKARSALQQLDEAYQAVIELEGNIAGTLSIAFSHHIGLHRLPPFLKQFFASQPQVHLDIEFVDSEQAYNRLREGSSELALITLAPEPQRDMHATALWADPLVFVCSPDHQLHLRDHVSLEELSQLDAILPAANTYTGQIVSTAFANQGLKLGATMTTNYLETIKMMVSIGLGWSVLPRTMTEGLEIVHVPDVYLERSLGIIEHSGRKLSNAANAFKALLRAQPV